MAVFVLLAIQPAVAGYWDGNRLFENCQSDSSALYVMGVVDGDTWETMAFDKETGVPFDTLEFFCIPTGSNGAQARDIVCDYLEDHPENRHDDAPSLIRSALSEKWPCH
jgi:hypothetical protein